MKTNETNLDRIALAAVERVEMAGQVAAEDYAQAQKQCQQALANVASKLKAHASKQSADSKNWGYVGDLGSVLDSLQEASSMLG